MILSFGPLTPTRHGMRIWLRTKWRVQMALHPAVSGPAAAALALERRALALWPRLDRAALRRCHQDPGRIAALIARRTTLPPEAIKQVLLMPAVSEDDVSTWFG
jgi:hypothetical protein